MSKWTKRIIGLGIVLGMWLMIALAMALTTAPNAAQAAGQAQAATATPTTGPTATLQVPFFDQWVKSPHNDFSKDNPVFHDWDEPATAGAKAEIPTTCAQCHSTPGYQDFLGADGSKAGVVDKPAPIGTTITCVACHNTATQNLTSVTFLSTTKDKDGKDVPITITGLGPEARCMVCHQGRATKTQVDKQIADFKATDNPDATPAPITSGTTTRNFGFLNIHYFAAAITLYGSEVHGGYEYDGKTYDVKFDHVTGIDNCVACHNPHTTELRLEVCAECHTGVKTVADLHKVREPSSLADYDGDGNITEGMYDELAGMRDALYKGIQQYAKDVSKTGIVYDAATYPYWFLDANNDGKPDQNDKKANIGYNAWTPRLLKAAYNLQVATKDPGAYAHGNKYIAQLLYDSLEDLNTKLTTKIDMAKMHRNDPGHFAGNSMAFRDWDDTGMVPGTCSRCHSAAGLPQFIKEGVTTSQPTANGFQCSTCHDETAFPKIYAAVTVPFPSGAKLTFGDGKTAVNANICLECHQGRESTVSVTKAVTGLDPDTVSDKISFRNVHYFAAGATLFGTDAKGIFEYPNQKYNGKFNHPAFDAKGGPVADKTQFATCTTCHDKHALAAQTQLCGTCHSKATDPKTIRMGSTGDFDGDGNATEGLAGELEGYQKALLTAIQSYAKDVAKAGILYDPNAYPYWFLDANNDGKPDQNDQKANIAYNKWTPRLLEAAYNYQYSVKDPGDYVHNGPYVMQAMYDSIADLNTKLTTKVDQSKMVRPPVKAPAAAK